ncbi:MAG TPA: anti-sigma factor antagonist, partial [Phycisphaerales bacterium]|nr:anti-sigma factor antagonist [Phycisphaerales bacterium]
MTRSVRRPCATTWRLCRQPTTPCWARPAAAACCRQSSSTSMHTMAAVPRRLPRRSRHRPRPRPSIRTTESIVTDVPRVRRSKTAKPDSHKGGIPSAGRDVHDIEEAGGGVEGLEPDPPNRWLSPERRGCYNTPVWKRPFRDRGRPVIMVEPTIVNFTEIDDGVVIDFTAPVITGGVDFEQVQSRVCEYLTTHEPRRVVVDLTGVRYFSSTMLGLLVDLWKRLRKRGGRLVISGVARELERLFEITNLNT